jgi:hypothetical protein
VSEPDRIEQLGLPELGVASVEDDDLESQSGLGRGLSSIIPQLADLDDDGSGPGAGGLAALIPGVDDDEPGEPESAGEPPVGLDEGAVRQLREDLIRALLDGLVNTMRLDLCAYVHQENGGDPELFLRAPVLASLGPQGAWVLFAALRDAVGRTSDRPIDVAGLHGVLVATGGSRSTGVFALARSEGLTDREQAVAGRFCASFGRAVHQLVDDRLEEARTGDQAVTVEIHEARDSVLARVQLSLDGRPAAGSGRADTTVEAVTRAVIDAQSDDPVFRYASEVAHGGEHAAVVLLESEEGAVALGSAVTRHGGGQATAHAAARARAGLPG